MCGGGDGVCFLLMMLTEVLCETLPFLSLWVTRHEEGGLLISFLVFLKREFGQSVEWTKRE